MTEPADRAAMEGRIAPFRIDDPEHFRLASRTPDSTDGIADKEEAQELLDAGVAHLEDLQSRLAAQDRYGLLVVLQGLDASGKDGAIRHVMSGVNPQGVRVVSFKSPSGPELDHHFLWRTTLELPRRGEIGIFNRSHYEEVLVVRVHPDFLDAQRLPPADRSGDLWARRFREINDWERTLVDNGFKIVKLFLHLSRDEQRRRLLARIDTPAKNWKFSMADVHERARWDDYQHAFEEMIRHTSTPWAPWFVVPADHKWFARVIVAEAIGAALSDIDPKYPSLSESELIDLRAARVALERD